MPTVKLPFYAKLALILVGVIAGLFLMIQGKTLLIPLFFALLLSILLYPIYKFLERKLRFSATAAAFTSLLILIVISGGLFSFLSSEMVTFFSDFPDLKLRFISIFNDLQHWLSHKMHVTNAQQQDYLNKSVSGILETAARNFSDFFLSITNVLFLIVFVLLFTFFILFYHRLLMQFAMRLFSEEHRDKVKEVLMETKSMINGYVVGLLTEMVIMGFANSILLMILKVPYAILMGILAAVLNIIPYIGIYTSIILIVFVTFAYTNSALALEAGAGLLILHIIDSNILLPKIVGSRVKMNSFITIIAVVLGEFIWGIPGMFLFIPLIAILKLIFERVEGLEAWGMLIGVYAHPARTKSGKDKPIEKTETSDN